MSIYTPGELNKYNSIDIANQIIINRRVKILPNRLRLVNHQCLTANQASRLIPCGRIHRNMFVRAVVGTVD